MLKPSDSMKGLDIDIQLSDQERSILSSYVKQQGFDITQRLLEDQVRKFNLKLINTDPSDSDKVVAAHHLAKVVAMFYQGFISRIQHECAVEYYNNGPKEEEPQPDVEIEELV